MAFPLHYATGGEGAEIVDDRSFPYNLMDVKCDSL